MQLCIADQQVRDLRMVATLCIAVQRVSIVFLQFIVESASAEQRFLFFFAVFSLHLPEEKGPELWPEVEVLHIVIAEHGGMVQKPI